jgi:hypothetical protein
MREREVTALHEATKQLRQQASQAYKNALRMGEKKGAERIRRQQRQAAAAAAAAAEAALDLRASQSATSCTVRLAGVWHCVYAGSGRAVAVLGG